jgi:predicted O-methyltransferase YrrM
MKLQTWTVVACLVGAGIVLWADLGRRKFFAARSARWRVLSALDVACPAITVVAAIALMPIALNAGALPLFSPYTWALIAAIPITVFIWTEGQRQLQFQRPEGIVVSEWLILAGAVALVDWIVFGGREYHGLIMAPAAIGVAAVAVGIGAIVAVVPPFVKRHEGLRVLDRLAEQGESVHAEYTAATPECPHPELWKMTDPQTSELEVLEFLESVVRTVKPHLIVETGTFIGHSAIRMAAAMRSNGFGRVITIEYDTAIYAKARENVDRSGLGDWIECRNESSLETRVKGTIDILFSDSHIKLREQEVRRFLPQIDPRGLILIHDSSSHFQVVREAALRLEHEGLISVVLLSTPRGLVVAQRRDGRK